MTPNMTDDENAKTKRVNLRLPAKDADRLAAIAERKRTTAAALAREAIGRALDSGLLA